MLAIDRRRWLLVVLPRMDAFADATLIDATLIDAMSIDATLIDATSIDATSMDATLIAWFRFS